MPKPERIDPDFSEADLVDHIQSNGVDILPPVEIVKEAHRVQIRKSAGVVGGEARIRDTRIPVWSLVQLQQQGAGDGEIKVAFEEQLSDGDLSAAWDYYKNNKQEIDDAIECNEAD